jgi:hypothetical protein
VDRKEIQTRPTGVVLVVTSTLPRGRYLTYSSNGAGGVSGGSDLPDGTRTYTEQLAPGVVTLGCEDAGEVLGGHEAKVRVSDPGSYWRGFGAINDLGCAVSGVADWKSLFFQKGSTAQGAVHAVAQALSEFETANRRAGKFTVREMATGYVADPAQIWLAEKDGKAYATIRVDHRSDEFSAGPLDRCRQG